MKKIIIPFLIFILFISCQTSNSAVDYDTKYNFSEVKTYDYYIDNIVQSNSIDSTNILQSLDLVLESKGLKRDTQNPDVYIALQVDKQDQSKTSNIVNLGVGGGGRWFGLGTSVGIPITNKVTAYSIQIAFDDAKTENLIWTGKTIETISYGANSQAKSKFFRSSIESLLKGYPPKIKKTKKAMKNNYYN